MTLHTCFRFHPYWTSSDLGWEWYRNHEHQIAGCGWHRKHENRVAVCARPAIPFSILSRGAEAAAPPSKRAKKDGSGSGKQMQADATCSCAKCTRPKVVMVLNKVLAIGYLRSWVLKSTFCRPLAALPPGTASPRATRHQFLGEPQCHIVGTLFDAKRLAKRSGVLTTSAGST